MSGTPAIAALRNAGVPFTIHEYTHTPGTASYGLEAATELERDPNQVFKTLIVADGQNKKRLAVGIIPVNCTLSLKKIANVWGTKRVAMADPAAAQRTTGYVTGGISPLGQRRALPTFIDESALIHETILVSGGQRGLDLELSAQDLAALVDARFVDIAH